MSRAILPLALLLAACERGQGATSTSPENATQDGDAVEVPGLPGSMLGTFVPTEDAASGRVLIVSEDMLAAIECAECGLPTYVRLDTITCTSADACEVDGAGCHGRLRRSGDALTVSMTGAGDAPATCALYAGEFVPGEAIGTQGQVIASTEAPAGRAVIGDIRSPREIDLDRSRRVVDGRVPELDACYQHALIDAPTLSGRLVIEIVHGSRGVSQAPARVHESSFEHPSLGDCVAAALGGLELPIAADGLPAPVYYTIELVRR